MKSFNYLKVSIFYNNLFLLNLDERTGRRFLDLTNVLFFAIMLSQHLKRTLQVKHMEAIIVALVIAISFTFGFASCLEAITM